MRAGVSLLCPIAMYKQLTQVSPFLEGRVRPTAVLKAAVGHHLCIHWMACVCVQEILLSGSGSVKSLCNRYKRVFKQSMPKKRLRKILLEIARYHKENNTGAKKRRD